ncbi:T9SS sorting signal type C domain-containing protein [Flavobacterium piscisymbiosum]|uniref:T9SS sorting signal type C domain-containing protein n=1 Tax=Flavobacterium piscisymbiosum TaxID=2893753 RepID=A0ABS8M9Q8_9FLAO|nr:T9SS sorting signal type C domain-containing protein [Flavobacterium sp. F-30]MCC9062230.1 T9SS sorting signal type C domain-containing protein [Flavobacterium sp. F-30]
MKKTLLFTILFFKVSFLSFVKDIFRFPKFYFKAITIFFLILGTNISNAQCNSSATAGEVQSNNNKMCVGTTENFWSTGWDSGTWSSSDSSILEVNGTTATAKAPGVAYVIYTLRQPNCNEVKTAQKMITVYPALGETGEISGPSVQCDGNKGQIYSIAPVANATHYVWNIPSNWTITSGANTNSITVTIGSTADNITVVVSNDCRTNYAKYKYVNITSNKTDTPTITAKGSTDFCQGGNVVLTSSTADHYLWSNGETTQSITVTSSGNYTVTTTQEGYYCPSNASNSIAVNATGPEVTTHPQTLIVCEGQSANFSVATSASNPSYQWQYSANGSTGWTNTDDVEGVSGHKTSTLKLKNIPLSYGNNYVRCVISNSICSTYSNTAKLTVNPNNTIVLSSAEETNNQTICNNTAITDITYHTTGATHANFQGLPNGVIGSFASNKVTISGTPTETGTFNYIIDLTGGCGTLAAIGKIVINPSLPTVSITSSESSTTICNGTLVTFKGTPTNGGTAPKYQWYLGSNPIVGQTGSQYTTNGLNNLDAIKVVMTSNSTSSCLASKSATSNIITVTITKTDRGRTKGGIHICQGDQNPPLAVYNFDDPNKDALYSDPSKIIRWEYSDDNNKTWKFIENTAGKVTYTPTEILTASRNYRAVAKNGSCNEEYAIETRIDVEFAPTINSQSTATQTQCINGTFNPISISATGFEIKTYQWYSNTTASTINATSLGNKNGAATNTYTPQSTTAGTLYYYCIVTGKCGSTTSTFSEPLVTKRVSTPPKVGAITQPNCTTSTGSVVLEDVPHSGRLLESRGTVYNFVTAGTTFEISGLAPGTYKFAIDDNCSIVYSSEIVIQPANTWNGNKWSNGTPSETDRIEFTGNYDIDTNLNGCSCTINSGAVVTIKEGRTLAVANAVTVLDGGSLIFENNSSLLQSNNVVNTGNITYKRTALKIRQADFVYWSTPVKPQQLLKVSPDTKPDLFYYHHGSGWIDADRNADMIVGKGYIIRGPETYSNTDKADYTASFIGVPNNGDIVGEPLTAGKYRLIGNPYPSALSIDKLIQGNTVLNGTVYFWTHNTAVTPVGNYDYNPNDYASYNLSGSVRTSKAALTGNEKPSGYVGAGQAFFVSGRLAGPVLYNNSMRFGGTNNNQFFKSSETSKETSIEKNRIWLNMTSSKGTFKQLLIGYIEGATNAYENKFDGVSFDGNPYLDFYSMVNTTKLVIQGRALPFVNTDVVPLGYKTSVEDTFTIAIDEVDGKMSNQAIYLEDKKTGIIHDLRSSDYTFKSASGTFTDRFVLKYANKTLGTGDFENTQDGILISVKNKTINVLSSKENIKEVTIFDIMGKTLYNKNKVSNTELQIQNLPSSNQVLLVKVTLENDFTTTRKIIFQ